MPPREQPAPARRRGRGCPARARLLASAIVLAVACGLPAAAQPPGAPPATAELAPPAGAAAQAGTATTASPRINPHGRELLARMAGHYRALPAWHAELVAGGRMDVWSGPYTVWRTTITVELLPPNRLKLVRRGDQPSVWVANGTSITLFRLYPNQYLQRPQPATLAQALLDPELQAQAVTSGAADLLARLLSPDPLAALLNDAQRLIHYGRVSLRDVPAELIVLEYPEAALRLHIAAEGPPWLLRIEPQLARIVPLTRPDQTQTTAQLTMRYALRNQHTRVAEREFGYRPPLNARRVERLAAE